MRQILSVFLLLLLLTRCGSGSSTRPTLEEVSKVKFPDGFEMLEQYENSRTMYVSLVRIPKDKIESFSKQYSFQSIDSAFVSRKFIGNKLLRAEHKAPAFDSKFRVAQGCSEHRHWMMYLDPQSGNIWCLIEFPDEAGATPC